MEMFFSYISEEAILAAAEEGLMGSAAEDAAAD